MGSTIILAAMLCIFFARDLQLLVSPGFSNSRLAIYGLANVAYLVLVALWWTSTGSPSPLHFFHASPFWAMSVVCHCCIWLLCLAINRRRTRALHWLPAVVPTPVLLVALASFAAQFQTTAGLIAPVIPAGICGMIWSATMSVAVWWLRRNAAASNGSGFAIEFAGMANTTVLILVPATAILEWL